MLNRFLPLPFVIHLRYLKKHEMVKTNLAKGDMMKKLVVMLSLAIATAVNAGEIKLKEFSQFELWGNPSVGQEFQINEELGRAWVSIKVTISDPDGGGSTDEYRVKVPGLSYDKATSSINIDFEGKITECAVQKTLGRSIFRRKEIVMTSSCKLEGRWRAVTYDDGFEIKKTSKYEVFLIVE
jgi:hypothetical protein